MPQTSVQWLEQNRGSKSTTGQIRDTCNLLILFPFAMCPSVCLGQSSSDRRLLSSGSRPLAFSTALSSIINILPRSWVETGNLYMTTYLSCQGAAQTGTHRNTDLPKILWSIISQILQIQKLRPRRDKWFSQNHTDKKKRVEPGLHPRLTPEPTALYCLSLCTSMAYIYANVEIAKENGVGVIGQTVNRGKEKLLGQSNTRLYSPSPTLSCLSPNLLGGDS